jgi:hypothetical protein
MNAGPVSWFARVMRTVALSSSEAELMACTEGGRDIVHIKQVCQGLGINKDYSVQYGEDNTAALAMATDINQSVTTRSKHIALRHFWIRERTSTTPVYEHGYENDEDAEADSPPDFKIFYVPSKYNTADMFTKSLPEPAFIQHRDSIMVEMADTCSPPGTAKPNRGPFPVNAYGLRNQFDHELAEHYYYW